MTTLIITASVSFIAGFLTAAFFIGSKMNSEAYDKAVEQKLKEKESKNDPLDLLREDCYSNEELDEMSGRMHRKQYSDSQRLDT